MLLRYPIRSCKYCHKIFEAINPKQAHCSLPCRFWSKVKIGTPDMCWPWQAYRNFDDYGMIRINGKSGHAHRICWQLIFKEIPKGFNVLHHCDNPSCVNPRHLFLGTQADNIADMFKKNRSPVRKGEMNGNAKLSIKDVLTIKKYIKVGYTNMSIAKAFKVTSAAISQIKMQKKWSHA